MNIVKENIDDLNAVIKVKISPEDYNERYNTALKRYQKKVDMPGFRPGKVPVDMVKKRFGKHILVEEINDMLSESLHKYIADNKIDILGNPLPKDDNHIDFEHQTEFEFQYELGLAPKMNIELSPKEKYSYYTVKIDDALVEKNVEYIRRNYGQVIHPEISEEKDILIGDFAELDAQGNILAGGVFKTTLIAIEKVTNDANRKKLIGLKKDDKIVLTDLSDDAAYIFEILELPADKLKGLSLQFTLKTLSRIALADLNQELFDKVYGAGKVNSVEEFRNKIVEEISIMHTSDSDRKFMNEIAESLMKKTNLTLPEKFLKKFLYLTNKEKTSMEQVEKEYHSYSDALKWQLIENHLLKTNNITVSNEEAEKYVSDLVKMNYAKRAMSATEEQIKEQVKKVLSDEKQVRNTYDRLYDQKLIELFKKTFTLEKKELPFEEFFKKPNP
ncbi:MAG TPA: trigger factor [Bacteroidia bacterium]|jgi:trigger factor|nr:trigger factor [Bacteroidia bacterium]